MKILKKNLKYLFEKIYLQLQLQFILFKEINK